MEMESGPVLFADPLTSRWRKYFIGLKLPSCTEGQATSARHGFEKDPPTVVEGST